MPTVDPVANPGGPYTGTVGQAISFDSSVSSAPGGIIQTYAWDFGNANNGSGVTTDHTYTSAGVFNVSLTVTDDQPA